MHPGIICACVLAVGAREILDDVNLTDTQAMSINTESGI